MNPTAATTLPDPHRTAPHRAGVIRLLVVDDHLVVREGTALLLRQDPTIALVGYARTGAEAIAETARTLPDVVLLDLRLPDMLAPEATPELRQAHPQAKILVFTAFADHAALDATLAAGADGLLLKDVSRNELVGAIHRVALGERVIDPRVDDDAPRGRGDTGELTAREYDVLRRVALGETNPEIAAALDISRNTVKSYLQVAMQKLGARNRVEVLVKARDAGLL